MELKTRKLTEHFGLEIQDINLAAPLTDERFAAIDDAFRAALRRCQPYPPDAHHPRCHGRLRRRARGLNRGVHPC